MHPPGKVLSNHPYCVCALQSTRPMTPSIASVAEVRRKMRKGFFASCYSWCYHSMLTAERRNRCQHARIACMLSHTVCRCTSLFRFVTSRPFSLCVHYRATPITYGVPEMMHARQTYFQRLTQGQLPKDVKLLPAPPVGKGDFYAVKVKELCGYGQYLSGSL